VEFFGIFFQEISPAPVEAFGISGIMEFFYELFCEKKIGIILYNSRWIISKKIKIVVKKFHNSRNCEKTSYD
jgi:hypothetical protein